MSQSFHHALPFGAELQPGGTTHFRIWAPSCKSMGLRLPGGTEPMRQAGEGWFEADAAAPAGTEYAFTMPDGTTVPDPASRMQLDDVHGASVVTDPGAFRWQHPEWKGRPWAEAVIYELHVGLLGGFKGVEAKLPELARLGFTAIELMPLSDVPGKRNWGYDGVLPYAPDWRFGTPDELKSLIDAAHGLGLTVFVDVVYNHFGPDGAYIHAYAKEFFREDLKTPWGAAIDFRRPQVRDYFIQNALYWIEEFRVDGLRFDAVHAISEEDFLLEMAACIREAAGDRHVQLVLEHENNASHLYPAPRFDGQWADDFHHCLHVLLTGESEGYYGDFQDAAAKLAKALAEGFVYQGQEAPHLGRSRGEPSGDLPTTAFVVCLQNHDQIGNRAMGERLTTLAEPAKLRAATALLLLCPFIPLVFMGEEYASTSPFLFFTDHNPDLAKLVDEGRREEFKHFDAFKDEKKRDRIPAPNDPNTFEASRPERTDPAHADWIAGLLRLRREHVVPGIEGARSQGARVIGPAAVEAEWAMGDGRTLTILLNLGDADVSTAPPARRALFLTPGAAPDHLPPGSIAVLLA